MNLIWKIVIWTIIWHIFHLARKAKGTIFKTFFSHSAHLVSVALIVYEVDQTQFYKWYSGTIDINAFELESVVDLWENSKNLQLLSLLFTVEIHF